MSWYAVDELGSSFDQTKEFLLPFDLRRWLKLSVIIFFAGGSTSSFQSAGSTTQNTGRMEAGELTGELGNVPSEIPPMEEIITSDIFIAAVALIGVLFLLLSYLSAVFTFVFYRSIRDDEVALKASFSEYAYDGFKYFVFNLGMFILWILTVGGLVAAFFFNFYSIAFLLPIVIPLWILLGIVSFVVKNITLPEMVVQDTGFIKGLRKSYGYIRDEWKQAGVFLIAKIVIGIVVSVLMGTAVVIAAVGLAIPLVIIGILLYLLHPWLVGIAVVVGITGILVAWVAVAIPIETYVYTWVLNVYGSFSEESETDQTSSTPVS